jgi:imidazole glycerol phosphate synthase glutamine amidotransferase subunit
MNEKDVVVVRTGTANLASVVAGLRRLGAEPRICEEPEAVVGAHRVVLPGVGTVAAAMERLAAAQLIEPLRDRVRLGQPTLAVCLGLQLLCEGSEESPDSPALGVVKGMIKRFSSDRVRVPQLGWNSIKPQEGCRYLREGYVYFANSFRLTEAPAGWSVAWADYDGPFVAAMERGNLMACQFHPELSGRFGLDLLARWLEATDQVGEVESC